MWWPHVLGIALPGQVLADFDVKPGRVRNNVVKAIQFDLRRKVAVVLGPKRFIRRSPFLKPAGIRNRYRNAGGCLRRGIPGFAAPLRSITGW
ncbi:MAG: hypothetical protein OXF88_11430 [Rhodobacteraceae bacterium]|nr:hypothetical protein [Paracoccaceae bacterium]